MKTIVNMNRYKIKEKLSSNFMYCNLQKESTRGQRIDSKMVTNFIGTHTVLRRDFRSNNNQAYIFSSG